MVRQLRHKTLWLCFTLIICLSILDIIFVLESPCDILKAPHSQIARNIVTTVQNASFGYPVQKIQVSDYTRLIDLENFEFTIMNSSCNETHPLLLIIIHSAPSNVDGRKVIRQTWGQKMDNVELLFAVGKVTKEKQQLLDAENNIYGDFIQGNFEDTYRNLTYKHAMVFKYAIYHCPSAKFILKVDDDVFVNLVTYMEVLHRELTLNGVRDLLFCNVLRSAYVIRNSSSKWQVSYDEYPNQFYPDYCPGWSVLYTNNSLFKLYTELQKAGYFWIDDVMITGIKREKVHLTLMDNSDWLMQSRFFRESAGYPWKPFLYGPPELDAERIWKLWNYTMNHTR